MAKISSRTIKLSDGRQVFCLQKPEAEFVAAEIGEYFQHGIEVRPGDVVFDVGANIGLFTLDVFARCNGDVDIYAFEPIPQIHAILAKNVERHGSARIRAMNIGLSTEPGNVEFQFFPRMTIWSSSHRGEGTIQGECDRSVDAFMEGIKQGRLLPQLRILPLGLRRRAVAGILKYLHKSEAVACRLERASDIIRQQGVTRIDLLKIDVERAEFEVLNGFADEHWPMVRQVVAELDAYEETSQRMIEFLKPRGFDSFFLEQSEGERMGDIGKIYAIRSASATAAPATSASATVTSQATASQATASQTAANSLDG